MGYWTMPAADKDMGACHAIELSYIFNNPQETIYIGGLYNTELADAVQDMWVSFARDGNPGAEEYIWEPYSEESRQTMVLGNEIRMEDDLKSEQRLLVEPLLSHYFNGCYSQMSLFVPQTWRIIAQLVVGAGLIIIIIVLVLKILEKTKKNTVG